MIGCVSFVIGHRTGHGTAGCWLGCRFRVRDVTGARPAPPWPGLTLANGTGTGLRERIVGFWRAPAAGRWLVGIPWAVLVLMGRLRRLGLGGTAGPWRSTRFLLVTLILPRILIGVTAWLDRGAGAPAALLAALADPCRR